MRCVFERYNHRLVVESAWSRSSCCPGQRLPLFVGEEFLCGQDHLGSEKYLQTLVFWSKCGCGTWMCCLLHECLVDVKCARICCCSFFFLTSGIFHKKKPKADVTIFYVGLPFSPCFGMFYTYAQNSGKNKGPKRKRLRASRPPCSVGSLVTWVSFPKNLHCPAEVLDMD